MSKTQSAITLLIVLVVAVGPAWGQATFQDLVKEQGLGWVIGRWTAQTDDGDSIELSYRWALKGQMIVSTFKMGDEAYQGIIYLIPDEEKVVEVGVHGDGDRTKATWEPQGDKLVSTREKVGSYGDSQKMAAVFSKGGKRGTLSVAIHGYEYGSMSSEPMATLEFKRQPARKKAKASK